jgi:hypothetical protein
LKYSLSPTWQLRHGFRENLGTKIEKVIYSYKKMIKISPKLDEENYRRISHVCIFIFSGAFIYVYRAHRRDWVEE